MRILIVGGDGMLGHQFLRSWRNHHDVKVTLHRDLREYNQFGLFTEANSYSNVDICSPDRLAEAIMDFSPEAVINAVGVTKQCTDSAGVKNTIEVNALFPHHLAALCKQYGARLVHMSTDCIFSGRKGFYSEDAISDAEDLYGRSKFLGEVDAPHVITLRKSTIGLELAGHHGLIEWFLAQKGEIKGFRGAIYSGLISSELACVIECILLQHPTLRGVWNIASKPINKYELLRSLATRLGRQDIEIKPDDNFICDRSLDAGRFEKATGYIAPSWIEMLDKLALQIEGRS